MGIDMDIENIEVQCDAAAYYIGTQLKRLGRIHVTQTKEKYLTARVYCSFNVEGTYGLVYPGEVYVRADRFHRAWAYKFDNSRVVQWTIELLKNPIWAYQAWVYKMVYARAIKRWPGIAKNILSGADYPELLNELYCIY